MSHCAPEATLNPIRLLKFTPETVVMSGRLFQTRGPATAKLLSPNVLCVRGTAHDLSVDERSRRLGPSETECMSSVKYGGALPDNDEKTKHASLKSTRLWTGSQCNWRKTGEICSPRLAPVRRRAAAFSYCLCLPLCLEWYNGSIIHGCIQAWPNQHGVKLRPPATVGISVLNNNVWSRIRLFV